MEIKNVAAHTLLDRGVRINVRAPWFLRLFGKKEFAVTVRRLRYGVSLAISERLNNVGLDIKEEITVSDLYRLRQEKGKEFSIVIALALLNSYWLLWLKRPVATYIRAYMTEQNFVGLLFTLISFNSTKDFLNIIDLMRTQIVTNPPMSSQTGTNGS